MSPTLVSETLIGTGFDADLNLEWRLVLQELEDCGTRFRALVVSVEGSGGGGSGLDVDDALYGFGAISITDVGNGVIAIFGPIAKSREGSIRLLFHDGSHRQGWIVREEDPRGMDFFVVLSDGQPQELQATLDDVAVSVRVDARGFRTRFA